MYRTFLSEVFNFPVKTFVPIWILLHIFMSLHMSNKTHSRWILFRGLKRANPFDSVNDASRDGLNLDEPSRPDVCWLQTS